jgi:diadenosine tetraphosphate (Ap4A) HIT family hydrolase
MSLVQAIVPQNPVMAGAIAICAEDLGVQHFGNLSHDAHRQTYHILQSMAQMWEENHLTDQFFVFGRIADNLRFNWEVLPYAKCRVFITRMIQQIQVLWRIVFGGLTITDENRAQQQAALTAAALGSVVLEPRVSAVHENHDDPFCNPEKRARQVVVTGQLVDILYNTGPIGFGGERLGFLVVPKAHRDTFRHVTEDEYTESMRLIEGLEARVRATRPDIESVYLFHKQGKDAGVTVKHWHIQVIFVNRRQDFWGKLTVFKNIVVGSSRIDVNSYLDGVRNIFRRLTGSELISRNNEFLAKVGAFRQEFQNLNYASVVI